MRKDHMEVFQILFATLFSINSVQRSKEPGICISYNARVVLKFSTYTNVETGLLIYKGMIKIHKVIALSYDSDHDI